MTLEEERRMQRLAPTRTVAVASPGSAAEAPAPGPSSSPDGPRCPSCQAETDDATEVCFNCGQAVSALTRGALVGERYEILQILGRGGMGIVYRAFDRVLEEEVAIKVLRRDVTAGEEAPSRFRSEIKLARRVSHRNVCLIHDYGESGGVSYISMALLEARDLKHLLAEHPAGLPLDEVFDIAIQMAEGLQAIHEAGIVHRDLKPANIMLDSEGVVQLMDFGIAKETDGLADQGLTATGMVMGTPAYMSPEQCQGKKLGCPSDIYALGALIFELCSGAAPFVGDTQLDTMLKQIQEPPSFEGPGVERLPKSLLAILKKTLDKEPSARFQTAGQVAEALRQTRTGTLAPAIRPRETETETETRPEPLPSAAEQAPQQGERRSETRIETPLNAVLRRFDDSGVLQEERTIVENISRGGARVLTATRRVGIGALVELEEVDGDFRAHATVRNSHTGGDGIPRLGLRFEDKPAPDRLVQTDDRRQVIHSTRPPAPRSQAPAASPSRPPATSGGPRRERRTTSRVETPVEVWLKPLGADGQVVGEERTIAENIGHGGARVMTALSELDVGDALLFEEVGGDFRTRASIRHVYVGPNHVRRLNLQFLGTFPPNRLAPPDDPQMAATSAGLPEHGSQPDPGRGPSFPVAAKNPGFPRAGEMPADELKHSDTDRRSRIARAETTLTSARELMRKEQYWDAIKTIEPALSDVQDSRVMKRRMRILLAQATVQNPKWRKRAEAILQAVIEEEPSDVDGHYELAKLYQASGLDARAQREFRRVLEIDSAHTGATHALREAPAKHRWFKRA